MTEAMDKSTLCCSPPLLQPEGGLVQGFSHGCAPSQTRYILESWHIQHHPASLNRGKDTMPDLYAVLLADLVG